MQLRCTHTKLTQQIVGKKVSSATDTIIIIIVIIAIQCVIENAKYSKCYL